ncbi:hypothetical protein Ple7327_4615 [Pleurocapsa sp. PCC 7327]|nr:hypothetical protein Ple7327_4615 [Pleurocapsa sp. PCC 7327]
MECVELILNQKDAIAGIDYLIYKQDVQEVRFKITDPNLYTK